MFHNLLGFHASGQAGKVATLETGGPRLRCHLALVETSTPEGRGTSLLDSAPEEGPAAEAGLGAIVLMASLGRAVAHTADKYGFLHFLLH